MRVLVCPLRVGRAGLPGAFWCASPFPFAALSFCFARPPPGWVRPSFGSLVAYPPPFFLVLVLPSPCAPLVSFFLWFPAPGALGLGALFFSPPPPPGFGFFFLFLLRFVSPLSLAFSGFPALGALGLGAVCCLFCWPPASQLSVRFCPFCGLCLAVGCSLVVAAPPPPFRVSRFSSLPLCVPPLFFVFLSFAFCAPVVSGFRWFPTPAALGLGAVCCLFCWPPASRLSVRSRLFCVSRPALCCSLVVAAPPPPRVVFRGFLRCCSFLSCCFFRCAPPLSLAFFGFRPRVRWAFALCAVCFAGLRFSALRALLPLCVSCPAVGCPLVVAAPPFVSPGFRCCCSVLCFSFFGSSAVLAACPPPPVRAWCFVLSGVAALRCPSVLRAVLWSLALLCCGLLRAVRCSLGCLYVCCAVLLVAAVCFALSWGVVLCVPCPFRSVRCCVPCCWCACVVLFVWCVLLQAPGGVVRCCVLCCFLWRFVARCWVWRPVVVCWWCVLMSVSLSGRVVCFPVVGVVRCGALLPCVMFCGVLLSRGAVLLCSAVVLRCCLCLFFSLLWPVVLSCAVLCCWLAVLSFVLWWRLGAVVLVPSLRARTKKEKHCLLPCVTPRPSLCGWLT